MVYGVCNKKRGYCNACCKGSSTTYGRPQLAGLQESAKIPGWWECHTQGRLYTTNGVELRLPGVGIVPQTLKTEKHTCCVLTTWRLWRVKVQPVNQTDTLLSQNWAYMQALTWGPSRYSTLDTLRFLTWNVYQCKSVWVWNSSLRQTGQMFKSHRWCIEFVTKRGVIATRVVKGLLLHTVTPY